MAKHVVFLVHGMGLFSPTALGEPARSGWADPVVAALKLNWKKYPFLAEDAFDDLLEVVPITYDQVFHQYLARLAEEGKSWNALFADNAVADAADILEGLDDEEANFLVTNVCDVLLYLLPNVATMVDLLVQEQIVAHVRQRWDRESQRDVTFSVVAHSLGTAVVHSALNSLAHGVGDLAPFALARKDFRIAGYVSLANVSGVLHGVGAFGGTLVRPTFNGLPGYVQRFCNVHHAADPFVFPRRFSPPWEDGYESVRVSHCYDLNVHAFEHYVRHPEVAGWIFRAIFGEKAVTKKDILAAGREFRAIEAADPAAVGALILNLERELTLAFTGEAPPRRLIRRAASLLWRNRERLSSLGVGA
jgi:hypothetical protein